MTPAPAPAASSRFPQFELGYLREPRFTWQAALSLAEASKLAYETGAAIEDVVVADWGFEECRFLETGNTQAFFARQDNILLIAFRGTESVGDWLGNIDTSRSAWLPQPGKVHGGFLRAYGVIKERLADFLGSRPAAANIWITGHSLGGALAVLTGGDLVSTLPSATIVTFGQPRLADEEAANFLNQRFGQRLIRLVNNNDLVTRVPPSFRHAGRLIRFDASGNVEEESQTESEAVERPPLSEPEFEALQKTVEAAKTAVALAPIEGAGRAQALDATIEGIIPGLKDHRIDRYIAAIRRQLGPVVIDKLATRPPMYPVSDGTEGDTVLVGNARPKTPVLMRLRYAGASVPDGIFVNSRVGTIVSALVTTEQLEALRTDPRVASVEASRDAGELDLSGSKQYIGHTAPNNVPKFTEKGDRALIGVLDTGVDVLHGAFRDANGKTRIVALWIQGDASGKAPSQVDPNGFTQNYGTLYTEAEINAFIATGKVPNPDLRDTRMHGTHVASIAAGRGIAGKLEDGIAPEARLVVVVPLMKTQDGMPPSLGYAVSHTDALDFLARISAGQTSLLTKPAPMAINVSLGMNAGAHDGSSLLEAAFDEITGGGRNPGLVVVKSAGNERGHHGHARIQVGLGQYSIKWRSLPRQRPEDYFEFWYDSLDRFEFQLVAPDAAASPVVSASARRARVTLNACECDMELTPKHVDNGQSRLRITIVPIDPDATIAPGIWELKVIGKQVRSRNALIDGW